MKLFDLFRRKRGQEHLSEPPPPKKRDVAEVIDVLGADLSPNSDPRQIFAFGLCGSILDRPFVSQLLRNLPPESRDTLPPPDIVESYIFDLWFYSWILQRIKSLQRADVVVVLDALHIYVYRALLLLDMSEVEVTELQRRIPDRYREYDEAYAPFWEPDQPDRVKLIWRFAVHVMKHIFGIETEDMGLLTSVGFQVNNSMIACAKTYGDLPALFKRWARS